MIRHSYNVRVCHWVNLIASGYLLVSGVHIFLDFPELYWGHTGYQGHPAIFKLSDWGMSWDRAGELGDRMWGRNYHITFAWVFLLNGVVYVGWNLATGYFRDQMSLARVELTPRRLWADLRRHLPWPASSHGVPQPVVFPRFSATLVEAKIAKVLEKFSVEPAALPLRAPCRGPPRRT